MSRGTLWRENSRRQLLARLHQLTPDRRPRWGRLDANQMVCHLCDQLRVAVGEQQAEAVAGPLRWPPLKQLVIYWVPWLQGATSFKECFTTASEDWGANLGRLEALMQKFAAQEVARPWPPHPLFGRMDGRAWGYLSYRHFTHHLRQFGV